MSAYRVRQSAATGSIFPQPEGPSSTENRPSGRLTATSSSAMALSKRRLTPCRVSPAPCTDASPALFRQVRLCERAGGCCVGHGVWLDDPHDSSMTDTVLQAISSAKPPKAGMPVNLVTTTLPGLR